MLLMVCVNVTNIAYFFLMGKCDLSSFAYVTIALFLFIVGLNLKLFVSKDRLTIGSINTSYIETIYIFIVCILFGIINYSFILKTVGFGLFFGTVLADVKVTMFQGGKGLGIFKYISSIQSLFLFPSIFYAYYRYKSKLIPILGLLWFLSTSVLFNFSKVGFVTVCFDVGILVYYWQTYYKRKSISLKFIVVLIALGTIPAFATLSTYQSATGLNLLEYMARRIVDTGGGVYNYFVLGGKDAFLSYGYLDRLSNHFDIFLSVFRIKEWNELSYMNEMLFYVTKHKNPGFSPNPSFFLDGHFLFGWAGLFYAFFLGAVISIIRSIKTNIFLFYILVKISLAFVIDPWISYSYLIGLLLISPFIVLIKIYLASRKSVNLEMGTL